MYLKRITIFPIKSLPGIEVEQCQITEEGNLKGDREFAIRSEDGTLLRAKEVPELFFIDTRYDLKERKVQLINKLQQVKTSFSLDHEIDQISQWLSLFLQQKVRLENIYTSGYPDDPNINGPTLIAESTYKKIKEWFPTLNYDEIRKRFRTNLEIASVPAFWEESLTISNQQFTIGQPTLQAYSLCERCEVPIVEPQTGMVTPGFLDTFSKNRLHGSKTSKNQVALPHPYFLSIRTIFNDFTQNLPIKVNDKVSIIHENSPNLPEKKHTNYQKRFQVNYFELTDIEENLGEALCVKIANETHDTKSFYFDLSQIRPISYYPGQYISIEMVINNTKERRTYTISSIVAEYPLLSITVKKMPNGKVSSYLHDTFKAGETVRLYQPGGAFHCLKPHERDYLFIAAGSGITPFKPMVSWILKNTNRSVYLIFSIRTKKDVIFENYFNEMKKAYSNFHILLIYTNVEGGSLLNFERLSSFCPEWKEQETYVCGPEGFRNHVKEFLQKNGFPLRQFHEESFGKNKSGLIKDNIISEISISNQEGTYQSYEGETLLESLERQKVHLPSSCRIGICKTCKIKLISGHIDSQPNQKLSEKERKLGFFLACSSYPRGKVHIEL